LGRGPENAHTINLSPLSDQETAELVSHLISTSALSRELEQPILERSGGNPLYAEEFVRLLADRGLGPARDAVSKSALPEGVQALIAARLDTLTPDRKSLLQDAAVLGKVFWSGAVAEVGGRDEHEVELALHELARKELVRPARTSSMEGESEYSFWHLLVRDVAYSQIPRAERARRHCSAAAWIEGKAGERVEDLAEVLAHHYVQALELATATGDTGQARELALPARRFLALAGERADSTLPRPRRGSLERSSSRRPRTPIVRNSSSVGRTLSSRPAAPARRPKRLTRRSPLSAITAP
jgi:predicted ATPase